MAKYAQQQHGLCRDTGAMLLTPATCTVMDNVHNLVEQGSICGELAADCACVDAHAASGCVLLTRRLGRLAANAQPPDALHRLLAISHLSGRLLALLSLQLLLHTWSCWPGGGAGWAVPPDMLLTLC
jgi:hypothetical protein